MFQKIRVLFADDSSVMRRLVTETLSAHPRLEVAGVARHGREAIEFCPQLRPDVVVLDVEMPVMGGVEAAAVLRRADPTLPILMFGTPTTAGNQGSFDALACGASDYVVKPLKVGHLPEVQRLLSTELLPKVLTWGERRLRIREGRAAAGSSPDNSSGAPGNAGEAPPSRGWGGVPPTVLAIGVSTGGPNALQEVLTGLPADFPAPIVVVQHMPKQFTTLLAKRLDGATPLAVAEAEEGAPLEPGRVWLAPGGRHLEVASGGPPRVVLTDGPPENSCRPAVDVLFRSVAKRHAAGALGVVLTGMGRDGVEGCRAIKQAGGRVAIQDEASCTVWGMPRAVFEAGLADKVLPLGRIAEELTQLARGRKPQLAKAGA